jgi:hypothetical protein
MTLSKIESDHLATGVEVDPTAFAFDDASDKMLKKMSTINKNKENMQQNPPQYVEVPERR